MLYFYKDNNFTHDFAAFEILWPYRIKTKNRSFNRETSISVKRKNLKNTKVYLV